MDNKAQDLLRLQKAQIVLGKPFNNFALSRNEKGLQVFTNRIKE